MAAAGGGCYGWNCGVIFKISSTGKFSVLHSFTGGSDGECPEGNLLLDTLGNLYGTAVAGGNTHLCVSRGHAGCGTVFKLSKAGHFTILHKFNRRQGESPEGLVRDHKGVLYGTTYYGGNGPCVDGCGIIYKLTP